IWQPTALELGIQKGNLGYLYAVFMAGSALGAFVTGRISKKVGEVVVLLFCFAVAVTGFTTIFFTSGMVTFVCGLVQIAVGYGGFLPLLHAYMNVFVPSSIRASMNSLVINSVLQPRNTCL
ncbi:MAG: MFS transporter, partial [Theionarchaea archaeon]|nr:MFS transporter [Theionarchaea archaeon]